MDTWVDAAKKSPNEAPWKAIVKAYLSPEHCEHPEHGCPVAALAPELARVDKRIKPQIVAELAKYKIQMQPFMPAQVFKRYSQAKLNMMREVLAQLDRRANEHKKTFGTLRPN